jgi:serine/threonine-protein kinase BUR1
LKELLKLDWKTRINAIDALRHPYFTTAPLPARPEDIPRFKDSHELDRRNNRPTKQALPPAPQGGTVGGGGVNADWQGERSATGPPPPYVDRYVPGRDAPGSHRQHQHQQGSRVPTAAYGRDQPGNSSRVPDRDQPPSRVPAGARRPDGPRPTGDHNGSKPSILPPPPGEGARHPLPMNPLRPVKDTYIPGQSDRPRRDDRDVPRRDDRDAPRRDERDPPRRDDRDAPRRDDRDAPRRDDRRSRTPDKDRRIDRYRSGGDRNDRRPRDSYRDHDAPREDRYRADDRRDSRRDRSRERSPARERDTRRERSYLDR